ncbi:MAG TPA: AAA family ATPase [Candidatus Binataceae bacterium]|jgi:hypothetical protein|nr:AAA family ATPase [Candidatus Binataceae bacterium]
MNALLVGRDSELDLLERSLTEAASARGGVTLISGLPGVGKSCLLDELRIRAEASGFCALNARCVPSYLPGAEPPWFQLIRDCLAALPASTSDEPWQGCCRLTPAEVAAKSSQLLSECQAGKCLLGVLPGEPLPFRSICRLLDSISRVRPLLVTVDDLHNADESSLELLRFASHGFYGLRVLIVAAYCASALAERAQSAVRAIRGYVRQIDLAPLGYAATGEVLANILGQTPKESLIHRVHELSGGTPRLICEIEHPLLWQLAANPSDEVLPIPDGVRAAVQDMLCVLSAKARETLGIASVIGHTFEPELVFRVAELSGDDGFTVLNELENARLIRPAGEQRYRFVHGFAREVLLRQCLPAKKALLHQRIAAAIEGQHACDIEARAGEVARHLLASRNPGAAKKAIEYAQMAGRRGAQARDFGASASMYSMALQALDLVGETDDARRADILTMLGDAQYNAGHAGAAQETLSAAAEIALELTGLRRLVRITLALPEDHWGLAASPNRLAIVLADKLLDSLEEHEAPHRALIAARLAAELSYLRDERCRSQQLAAQALEIANRVDEDTSLKLRVLQLRDHLVRHPGAIQERLGIGAEVTRIASQRGDYVALFFGALARTISLFELGEVSRSDAEFELVEQASRLAGRPLCRAIVVSFKAMLAGFDGRLSEAEELIAQCRAIAVACDMPELADQFWPAMIVPFREHQRLGELEPVARLTFAASPHPHRPHSTFRDSESARFQRLSALIGRFSKSAATNHCPLSTGKYRQRLWRDPCAELNSSRRRSWRPSFPITL